MHTSAGSLLHARACHSATQREQHLARDRSCCALFINMRRHPGLSKSRGSVPTSEGGTLCQAALDVESKH